MAEMTNRPSDEANGETKRTESPSPQEQAEQASEPISPWDSVKGYPLEYEGSNKDSLWGDLKRLFIPKRQKTAT